MELTREQSEWLDKKMAEDANAGAIAEAVAAAEADLAAVEARKQTEVEVVLQTAASAQNDLMYAYEAELAAKREAIEVARATKPIAVKPVVEKLIG